MSPPSDGPALRAGAVVSEPELAALARAAVERSGRAPSAIAKELGKSPGAISDALNRPERSLTALRLLILQHVAGYTADGPLFRLRRSDEAGA